MLICTLFNEFVNDFTMRTSSNAVEGNLVFVVFYYFMKIKPFIIDKNTILMTVALTISFIVRSSSLLGYFPLFIFKIFENYNFIITFLVSAILITIPMCTFVIALDSYHYN